MNQSKIRCLGELGHTWCCWKAVLVPPLSVAQGKSIQMDATVRLLCPRFEPAACRLHSRSHVTTLALTVPAREMRTEAQGCAITGSHRPYRARTLWSNAEGVLGQKYKFLRPFL